jgi:iron-sulfur cluster repair protein YtfE (RIC family)
MDAYHARTLLITQHQAIRTSLAACLEIAKRLRTGDADEDELELALVRMRADVYQHNLSETELIRPMLAHTQRWGDLLIGRMIEEHLAEHVAMWTVLEQPARVVAFELEALAEDLDAHMAAEERTFLAPNVLREDVILLHSK